MKPDLLGYLLHNLDPADERAVEEYLEANPHARRQMSHLRQQLKPLDAWETGDPSKELLFNTLRTVATLKCQEQAAVTQQEAPAPLPQKTNPSAPVLQPWIDTSSEAVGGSWRRADVWVSIALVLLVLLTVPPVLQFVRDRAGQVECRDNLRVMSLAMNRYAQDHDGSLPTLMLNGKPATAGLYGPALREAGLWSEGTRLGCTPGSPVMPVTLAEAQNHHPDDYGWWTRVGGNYGYHMGYVVNVDGKLQVVAVRRVDGDGIPILGDRPPRPGEVPNWETANSPLHGFRGQNVLYNGGHVMFHTTRQAVLGEDSDIFSNASGQPVAGATPRDAVLGPPEAKPLPSSPSYPAD
jgi:hypothetical protein